MPAPITLVGGAKALHHLSADSKLDIKVCWEPTEFQRQVLLRNEKEIALLGGKFGGKSEAARMFLAKGNPDLMDINPDGSANEVNTSYLYHPNYYATILRRNQIDLDEFLIKAKMRFASFGGKFGSSRFEFPSGARINCGHLADRDAWMKYVGVETVRFVIEEAGNIPDFSLYEQILSCCRSVWPELRPQVLLTSNFGGPGSWWLTERFYEAKDEDGNVIPPGTTITETAEDPLHPGEKITSTRIFMFSTMRNNPYAEKDPAYRATLATLKDEKLRRAYIDGDWSAFVGPYFDNFRPRGPLPGEPACARHVYRPGSPEIPPRLAWYHQWGSIDVGYVHQTSVHWYYLTPQLQTVVEEELCADHTSFAALGHEIALRSRERIQSAPGHSLVFFVSPDAFAKRSESRSIVELLASGAQRVLGANMVHIPDLMIEQLRTSAVAEDEHMLNEALAKIRTVRNAGITFRRADDARVIGWQHCREALRFHPIGELPPPRDPELSLSLLRISVERYEAYEALYRRSRSEVLPKLLIVGPALTPAGQEIPGTGCPQLIAAIPKARHYPLDQPHRSPEDVDKAHFPGMDSLDDWRYGMMGKSELIPDEPYEAMRDRIVASAALANPNLTIQGKIWINRELEAKEASRESSRLVRGKPLLIPRKSNPRRRRAFIEGLQPDDVDSS